MKEKRVNKTCTIFHSVHISHDINSVINTRVCWTAVVVFR